MLRDRIISAAVAIAILVPVLAFGGVLGVTVVVAVCATIAAFELSRNLSSLKVSPGRELTLALCIGIALAFSWLPVPGIPALIVLLPLLILLLHLFLYNVIDQTMESAAHMALVTSYVAVPLAHAILLRRLDMGVAWVFFVLVVISLGDAGAYFAGKYCGKHHFSKRVSPAKTVEGLFGGVAGCVAGMLVMKLVAPAMGSLPALFWAAVLLAIVGPLGDLTASALKRRLGVKDFGTLMPGHGGILDRADALIMGFPVLYYYLTLTGIAVPA